MNTRTCFAGALVLLAATAFGQEQDAADRRPSFEATTTSLQQQLEESVADLNALRERLTAEKIPLSRELGELTAELQKVKAELQERTRRLDVQAVDLNQLRTEIKSREEEAGYLSNLLTDYMRNFESRLHIAELQRYDGTVEAARRASDDPNLPDERVHAAQNELLTASLDRLDEVVGGARFPGTAVAGNGDVTEGTFALVGPSAWFRSTDGQWVGTVEQRLGSLEPSIAAFARPEDAAAAASFVASGDGAPPLDPTLGNAQKIAATQETLLEHVEKGGPVMIPIFAMAAAALVVALYKWLRLATVRRPSRRRVAELLSAVGRHDRQAARERAHAMRGPIGRMLATGVDHLDEPRELIEEVMHEHVLTTRLTVQSLLPFIAICAASAPLLGLLGTVTGIISTFELITLFGSQDVKLLSGGISEALITTKFGLIVAIPSLLLHAYLTRKARGILGHMERTGAAFVTEVGKSRHGSGRVHRPSHTGDPVITAAPSRDAIRAHVGEILDEILGPLAESRRSAETAGANGSAAR